MEDVVSGHMGKVGRWHLVWRIVELGIGIELGTVYNLIEWKNNSCPNNVFDKRRIMEWKANIK